MITLCIYSVGALHVVADYISFATTFLFKKSSLIHSVAPPLQTEPAALGFGLVLGKPFGWAHLCCFTITYELSPFFEQSFRKTDFLFSEILAAQGFPIFCFMDALRNAVVNKFARWLSHNISVETDGHDGQRNILTTVFDGSFHGIA